MSENNEAISIYAVGDVCVSRENPESIYEFASRTINEADIAFCQVEAVYSDRGSPQVHAVGDVHARPKNPKNIAALKYAGFDVVSLASNHCLNFGYDAFFDTIDKLRANGLTVIGVGKDLAEARQPAIFECKGTRLAFLAYNSMIPEGFAAGVDKPGCAPVRVLTVYQPVEYQPGTASRALTFADREDLEAMQADIRKIRDSADIVVVSLHAGLHHTPAVVPMYHKEIAHAAVDAGADLVVSHHAHILKGIEVYKDKVIFYGLCNFGFDTPSLRNASPETKRLRALYDVPRDPEYTTYAFHVDAKKTIVAKCIVSKKQVQRVSFLPVFVNKLGQLEIQHCDDAHFHEVLGYIEDISRSQHLDTRFTVEGDEVVINAKS